MSTASPRLRIQASATYLNSGHRSAQEDFLLLSEEKGVFAVADGFGGPQAGARAARVGCEAVRDFLCKEAGDLDATLPFVLRQYFSLAGNVLFNALIHSNRKVNHENKNKSVHEKGGTSLIAGFMDGDLLALANVGACSASLLRGGVMSELVVPKTYARLMDPAEAMASVHESAQKQRERRSAPLMALGITEDLEPEIVETRIRPGDWVVFHSDGIPSSVRALLGEMQAESRRTHQDPASCAEDVAGILKSCPSQDNAAALVLIF